MTKSRNRLASLPPNDRQIVLNLCAANPYQDAARLIALPRSRGGLGILTSPSALCRFYTSSQPDRDLELLTQYADAANIRQQQHCTAFLGAIRASVEQTVLENILTGKALPDLQTDLKALKTVVSLHQRELQERGKRTFACRDDYWDFVSDSSTAPQNEFLTAQDLEQPNTHDFRIEPTPIEKAIDQHRGSNLLKPIDRSRPIPSLPPQEVANDLPSPTPHLALSELPSTPDSPLCPPRPPCPLRNSSLPSTPSEGIPPKTPVIPLIPDNSTSNPPHPGIPA